MTADIPARSWLVAAAAVAAVLATVWNASILAEGFAIWGGLTETASVSRWIAVHAAAWAIAGVMGCGFFALGFRDGAPSPAHIGAFMLLLVLTCLVPFMQTYTAAHLSFASVVGEEFARASTPLRQTLWQWRQMLSSLGQADIAFTFTVLLSLCPLVVQTACLMLLRLLLGRVMSWMSFLDQADE